jgi:hypothetical protein
MFLVKQSVAGTDINIEVKQQWDLRYTFHGSRNTVAVYLAGVFQEPSYILSTSKSEGKIGPVLNYAQRHEVLSHA